MAKAENEQEIAPSDDAHQASNDQITDEKVEKTEAESEKTEQTPQEKQTYKLIKSEQERRNLKRDNEELQRKLDAAQQEKELALLAVPGAEEEDSNEPPPMPDIDEIFDPDERKRALQDWQIKNNQYVLAKSRQESSELLDESNKTREQRENAERQQKQFDENLQKHYARADALNVDDFVELEEKLMSHVNNRQPGLADNLRKYFLDVFGDMSAELVAELANDLPEVDNIVDKIMHDAPGVGERLLVERAAKIKARLKPDDEGFLPNPDTPTEGGVGGPTQDIQALIEKSRQEKLDGKKTHDEHMKYMRSLKAGNI